MDLHPRPLLLFRLWIVLCYAGLKTAFASRGETQREVVRRSTGDECHSIVARLVHITGRDHETLNLPNRKRNDDELEICNHGNQHKTCCTRHMERLLHQVAMDEMRNIISSRSYHLKNLILLNSQIYQNQFLQLLSFCKNKTLTLLTKTYHIPTRASNVYIEKFFSHLKSFIENESDEIQTDVSDFFDSLFASVFIHTINDIDETTSEQKRCLGNARKDLNPSPFSEVIDVLSQDLLQSLGLARSLLNAFRLSVEVINATEFMHFDHQCSRGLTRLLHCSLCQGHLDVRPCLNFCMNIVNGCLAQFTDLNPHWNLFVDAVGKLVSSMHGSYDIEGVMIELDSAVSNGIMNAMEKVHKYNSQVKSLCGSLVSDSSMMKSSSVVKGRAVNHDIHHPDVKLHLKIEMFVRNLVASKGLYVKLPDAVCSSEKLLAGDYDMCWNGTSLGLYIKPVPLQDFAIQVAENPEMKVPESKDSIIVNLSNALDDMTKVLHSQVLPRLPMMLADERSELKSEYSGGSDNDDDDDDDDGDDYDEEDSGSSSGINPANVGGIPGFMYTTDVVKDRTTNTDFQFTERASVNSQSPYATKMKQGTTTTTTNNMKTHLKKMTTSITTMKMVQSGTGIKIEYSVYCCLLSLLLLVVIFYDILE